LVLWLLLFPRAGTCADTAQQLAQRVDKYYNGLILCGLLLLKLSRYGH